MSRRRRRKKDNIEKESDESWLIPYADIMTLLLALFIVLFSLSDVDAQKFKAMAQSFNDIFSTGTGVFEYPSPMPDDDAQGLDRQDKEQIRKETGEEAKVEVDKKTADLIADWRALEAVQGKIDSYITENNLTNKLGTSLTDEGLLVSIRDNVLFDSGSAKVRPRDVKVANEISNLLVMNPPRNIIISGHTDNVPINNSEFESNWELSVTRAINFMKILLENDQLDPRWFSAKGYGEFQPVGTNDTAEGREKNRRVEILILPIGAET